MRQTEKLDRRVKMTIHVLQTELITRLQQEHISKISVKTLCENADINRSTFYAHFKDQYDLLDHTCNEVFDSIKRHMELQHYPDDRPISFPTLHGILSYVRENAELFKALLSENCGSDVQHKILQVVMTFYHDENHDKRTRDYYSTFGLSGCISVIQMWLRDGMPESDEHMARIILKAIDKGIAAN